MKRKVLGIVVDTFLTLSLCYKQVLLSLQDQPELNNNDLDLTALVADVCVVTMENTTISRLHAEDAIVILRSNQYHLYRFEVKYSSLST